MASFRVTLWEAYDEGKSPWGLLSSLMNKDPLEVQQELGGVETEAWKYLFLMASMIDLRRMRRQKEHVKDVHQVIDLIKNAQNIVVILGAGGSVGLDFRSPGGLYDSIAKDGVFEDPCNVFDLEYFQKDPSIFWKYAHTIFPARHPQHSATHYFLQKLQEHGKLLKIYTQNVDTLEVGIPDEKLCYVHGSWRDCKCCECGYKMTIEELRPSVEAGTVPVCTKCGGPIMPGIVFFGQPTNFEHKDVCREATVADLLLVIGTSLRVAPISELPSIMSDVTSVLINRAPVTCDFNAQLLGECDDIVGMLERELDWAESGMTADDSVFFPPNNFVFESNHELGTRIIETARNSFLATSVTVDVSDLE